MKKVKLAALMLGFYYFALSTMFVISVDILHATQEVKFIWLTNWIVSIGVFTCTSIWSSK